MGDGTDRPVSHALLVLVGGLVAIAAGLFVGQAGLSAGLVLTGAILSAVSLILAGGDLRRHRHLQMMRRAVAAMVDGDPNAAFLTDGDGRILFRNRAAHDRFLDRVFDALPFAFAEIFANPAAMLLRIQSRADLSGAAHEDMVTRRGTLRVGAARVEAGLYLWRIEDLGDRPGTPRGSDALSLPMLTAGPSGTILYMNDAMRRLTGDRARTLDRVFLDLPLENGRVHAVDTLKGAVDCLVAEVAGSGGRREIYLLAAPAGSSQGRTSWNMVEELPVPMLKIAPDGVILATNREARVLLPMPVGPGTRLSDLLEGLGRPIIDWVRETAEGRGSGTAQFLRGTGPHQDLFVRVALSPGGQGDDLHIVAVLNDVTELKTLEAQFVQSQKMQAIGQLAGGVAHDFNNLLTAISGHCDLLILRHDQTDPDYPDLIQIHQNANRAASLVGQLLAFSRKQSLMPEVLDLRDTLSDLTHLLNRLVGERVRLTLDHDPALHRIRADKRQLEQVIMNLVVNARDAMAGGGEIRIETGNLSLPLPLERDRATVVPGDYVVVRVIDQGSGIPPERLTKIFEPFYTTKRPGEGTGLGLSTAYGIVKQTGGFIFVDSVVGEGTVFSLYFPICAAEDVRDASRAASIPPAEAAVRASGAPGGAFDEGNQDVGPDQGSRHGSGVRPAGGSGGSGSAMRDPVAPGRRSDGVVLLVEDEAPVRAFASRALRLRGYSVIEADSAESALALLADPTVEVDVFVTDVIMPGKDGPTWVREALRDRPETRVVFVSGYAEDAFAEQKSLIPNSVFLPKPFSLVDLTTTVQQQLH